MLKQNAALGFRTHSGWASMIALAEPLAAPLVVRRCRIELADRSITGASQPYHTAQRMALKDAEKYLRRCSLASAALARKAVQSMLAELGDYQVNGACVLLAAGRPLPDLVSVLASHALVHTAEGEFYRATVRAACECCGLSETGIRERDLVAEAAQALGRSAEDLHATIASLGTRVGSPWRQDEKLSTLAAWLVLVRRSSKPVRNISPPHAGSLKPSER